MADLLIRAYPRWWRERYGQEYAGLLEELPAYPGTVINVLTAGANVRLRPPERHPHLVGSGGPQMIFDLGGWHSRTFAWLALLIAAPTAVVLGLNAFAYNLAVPGLAGIADSMQPLLGNRPLGLYLMGAPALAFLVALLPVLRFSVARERGELLLSFAIRGRVLNLIALALCALLVAFWTGHSVVEYLFGT